MHPAERLLMDLGITDPRDIHLEAIALTQGVQVRYRRLDGCEAQILGHGDRAIIVIDDTRTHPRRQRFSLAHELGHWRHHRGRILVCRSDDIGPDSATRPPAERTADDYAAHLLIPGYLLRPLVKSHPKLTFQVVQAVCDAFDTSVPASAIRLIESRLFSAMVVCHGPGGRKWFARSPDVPDRWFPRDDLDPDSFAFDVLFGQAQDDCIPRKIGVDAWFERWEAERYEMLEQTRRTAPDEILTILSITEEKMREDYASGDRNSQWRR